MPCSFSNLIRSSIFVGVALLAGVSHAIDTEATGYRLLSGGSLVLNPSHSSSCRVLTNTSGSNQFVATKTAAEWASFIASPPTGVSASACDTHGFLVLTNGTWDGNLGGVAGADAKCLSDLTTYDWTGKSSATSRNLLIASRVKAFICTASACTDLQASKTYRFAKSNTTDGSTSFTTNASGAGPGSQFYWNTATTFGSNVIYYTGRAAGADANNWPVGASGVQADDCSGWTSTSGNGRHGNSNSQLTSRWSSGVSTCNTARPLVCIVNP